MALTSVENGASRVTASEHEPHGPSGRVCQSRRTKTASGRRHRLLDAGGGGHVRSRHQSACGGEPTPAASADYAWTFESGSRGGHHECPCHRMESVALATLFIRCRRGRRLVRPRCAERRAAAPRRALRDSSSHAGLLGSNPTRRTRRHDCSKRTISTELLARLPGRAHACGGTGEKEFAVGGTVQGRPTWCC